jgi:hypothetical protein
MGPLRKARATRALASRALRGLELFVMRNLVWTLRLAAFRRFDWTEERLVI